MSPRPSTGGRPSTRSPTRGAQKWPHVRLIADEVRGSVREAMKSLRADLASAARADQDAAQRRSESAAATEDASRSESREQVRRAESLVAEYRANVRADLRTHVAHGGAVAASVVDDLARALDEASRSLIRSLRG